VADNVLVLDGGLAGVACAHKLADEGVRDAYQQILLGAQVVHARLGPSKWSAAGDASDKCGTHDRGEGFAVVEPTLYVEALANA
jgi:hypothetical protein